MQEYVSYFENFTIWDYFATSIVIIIVFIWAWSILWTTKDISARTDNIFLQILSIIIVAWLTPIFWLPLYFLLRPIRYKYQVWLQNEVAELNTAQCQNCENINLKEFDHCIFCWSSLKTKCKECKKNYPKEYEYCPSCWAPNIEE